ncbi:hypothetical protein [Caballeronia glathei]|uniref:hypothetical protein n=1 Tax=Caballeronia glathei TaxID=60547 RepID=UPI001377B8BD|nr:hypothetical protein [Caballeronia glathei]
MKRNKSNRTLTNISRSSSMAMSVPSTATHVRATALRYSSAWAHLHGAYAQLTREASFFGGIVSTGPGRNRLSLSTMPSLNSKCSSTGLMSNLRISKSQKRAMPTLSRDKAAALIATVTVHAIGT